MKQDSAGIENGLPETVTKDRKCLSLGGDRDSSEASRCDKKQFSMTFETVQYTVQENDTLSSIGAHFDMGPSELKQLNKLMSSHVYIGQKLQIYAKNFYEAEEREKAQILANEKLISDGLVTSFEFHGSGDFSSRRSSAASDHLRSRKMSGRQDDFSDWTSEKSVDRIVRDIKKNRLRLNVKYVTDGQGVVSGTLLVTTNTIMFDPNVSDRLVIEHGPDPYVMVAPFEIVARLAIVDDISAMEWQSGSQTSPPVIYYGNEEPETALESSSPELLSSYESTASDNKKKCDSPVLMNGTTEFSSTGAKVAVENWKSGLSPVSVQENQKTKDALTGMQTKGDAMSTEIDLLLPDALGDRANADGYSEKNSNIVFIKNKRNLQDTDLVCSSNPEVFFQRNFSQPSCSLFCDVEQNHDQKFPSSLKYQNDVNNCHVIKSSYESCLRRRNSCLTFNPHYEIGKVPAFRKRQSYSNMMGNTLSPFELMQGKCDSEVSSKLIPVYSAKNIPRVGSNLPTVESACSSFCIPPGQICIVDLSWEQFGGIPVDDDFCIGVHQLPPLDEDAILKPDFYISDDEDDEDDDSMNGKPAETRNEVDVEKLLKCTDDLYRALNGLIPRPATHYEDLPWYLCVEIGCPLSSNKSKAMMSSDANAIENLKPVYWFSIHKQDVQPLFEFIMNHYPWIYGSEDQVNPAELGLAVLSQEIVNKKLETSTSVCQFYVEDEDYQNLPDVSEDSSILDANQLAKLNSVLFPRATGYNWKLVYTMERDGCSLQTLYRRVDDYAHIDPPTIIIIRDSSRTVFGAVLSCSIKRSKEYFGNGESFLFSFKDGFKKYNASCVNNYYGYGYQDSLCFGAYRGRCGLWIDGDLHHGRTQKCATYENDVLTLTEDFYIHQLEAWCLI